MLHLSITRCGLPLLGALIPLAASPQLAASAQLAESPLLAASAQLAAPRQDIAPRQDAAPKGDTPPAPTSAPGTLPADTSPEAAALWRSLCATTRVPREPGAAPLAALQTFDISFDQRLRSGAGRNEFSTRVRYLAPAYLRFRLESGREQMRGPTGDWLLDGDQTVSLRGREHTEDRKQMDDWLAVAGNFVSLSDPASLHVSRLALAADAPPDLPPKLETTAAALHWLTVASPDFRLFLDGAEERDKQAVFSAFLGLDPKTSQLALAVLHEIRADRAQGPEAPADQRSRTTLIQVLDHRELDGYIIPRFMNIHQWRAGQFERRPSMELFVVEGHLDAELVPADFTP
ncbi:MAG: hypothetical protein QF615_03275 [Planctomycetota bacterium]|nr:hypothetical protein [Planctomycetota bacterium]